ncbi:hypothetical protein MUN77_14165 [Leucobacter allii]|uniref:hypothetical protein n=1 Tax=Leucobacter allii TaxID=2932247 RepID=UPI001FD4291B|nr:hypothetical protein [Leucobacter allii]UOR01260.1 hypothetical protein MUN77_14165 [Leucobacter allii]
MTPSLFSALSPQNSSPDCTIVPAVAGTPTAAGTLPVTGGAGPWVAALIAVALVAAVLGVLLIVRARAAASRTPSARTRASRAALAAGATLAIIALVASPLGSAPASAAGLPEHCTAKPAIELVKGDAGDDTHEVDAGEHDIVVVIRNAGNEALQSLAFADTTESGDTVDWDSEELDALAELTLDPGQEVTLTGTVTVAEGETHRDSARVTGTGVSSGQHVAAEDPTTLIGPDGPTTVLTAPPTVTEACDVEPTVALAESEGVEYRTERVGDELIVRAVAKPGFVIEPGQQTEWIIDMTFDTSVWDDAAWPVDDPELVTGTIWYGDETHGWGYFDDDGTWVMVSETPRFFHTVSTEPYFDDDGMYIMPDWIAAALAAGAELTVADVVFTDGTGNPERYDGSVYWAGYDWNSWFRQFDPATFDATVFDAIDWAAWDAHDGSDGSFPETLPAGLPYPNWVEYVNSIPMVPAGQRPVPTVLAPHDGVRGLIDTGVRNYDQLVDWETAFSMPPWQPTNAYYTAAEWREVWESGFTLPLWSADGTSYAFAISQEAQSAGSAEAFDTERDYNTLSWAPNVTFPVTATRAQGICSASKTFELQLQLPS